MRKILAYLFAGLFMLAAGCDDGGSGGSGGGDNNTGGGTGVTAITATLPGGGINNYGTGIPPAGQVLLTIESEDYKSTDYSGNVIPAIPLTVPASELLYDLQAHHNAPGLTVTGSGKIGYLDVRVDAYSIEFCNTAGVNPTCYMFVYSTAAGSIKGAMTVMGASTTYDVILGTGWNVLKVNINMTTMASTIVSGPLPASGTWIP